jgi:guanylate kinase
MIPQFNRPTLVTLTGPTCSGKTFLRERAEGRYGWNRIVSTTTRPMRAGEVEGVDYYFITDEQSRGLEEIGQLAELVEFRGVRYGVTSAEMHAKFNRDTRVATVILEPNGLVQYRKLCQQKGIDVFSIYVHLTEDELLNRLHWRAMGDEKLRSPENIAGIRKAYEDRKSSIKGEERRWLNTNIWDAIVPGNDVLKALDMIELGIQWRNRRNEPVTA